MDDIISQCLGNRWAMFYTPSINIDQITSIQTLEQSIYVVNQHLLTQGRNFFTWPQGMRNEVARVVRINWMYQNLQQEPMRKPILTHYENSKYYVDCGDTRLMSLRLLNGTAQVSMLTTCCLDDIDLFESWTRITNTPELVSVTGFDKTTYQVFATPGTNWCFNWMEIGDHTTGHHLHDVIQRLDMLQNYINSQPEDFKFTKEWFKLSIDWASYRSS